MKHLKLGVFDSGLGGLTAVKELRRRYPSVHLIYIGDTARVPYGVRSENTIIRYTQEGCAFLVEQKVDAIVLACNTMSALFDPARVPLPVPIFGVIEPAVRAAAQVAGAQTVGVLGTMATIESGAYEKSMQRQFPTIKVVGQPAPLLVPLIEEGWLEGDIAEQIVRKYLSRLLEKNIDALILGCTHYPVLRSVFELELARAGEGRVPIIDSGSTLALDLHPWIKKQQVDLSPGQPLGDLDLYVTDQPRRFKELAERFLGQKVHDVETVTL